MPKSKKWLDGNNIPLWPTRKHIGWTVCTAGWVNVDDLPPTKGEYNRRSRRMLPPGLPMILKAITPENDAIAYRDDYGVLKMPVELLEPWTR